MIDKIKAFQKEATTLGRNANSVNEFILWLEAAKTEADESDRYDYGIDIRDDDEPEPEGEKEEIYRIDRYNGKKKKKAIKWLLAVPMRFLDRYFFSPSAEKDIGMLRSELVSTLDQFEQKFEAIGVQKEEVQELEQEFKAVETPQQFDQALEDLYQFGQEHGVWFENTMMKGGSVTAARVYRSLFEAWKSLASSDWVPKMDKSINTVVIEFADGRTESILSENQLNDFLDEQFSYNEVVATAGDRKYKQMKYDDYQKSLLRAFKKEFDMVLAMDVFQRLHKDGYIVAAKTLLHVNEHNATKTLKLDQYFKLVSFLDRFNASLGHSPLSDTDLYLVKESTGHRVKISSDELFQNMDLLLLNKTIEALKERGLDVKVEDYIDWLVGNVTKDSAKFDQAVQTFLTEPVYNTFKHLNLVDAKLKFELGLGPPVVDSVDVQVSPEKESLQLLPGFDNFTVEPPIVVYH